MAIKTLILRALSLLAFGVFLAVAQPASAQGSNTNFFSPTKESVKEDQLLNALKPGSAQQIDGRISIPDGKASTLIRPAGREWREFHQGTMLTVAAVSVLGMLALLLVFYFTRGKVMIEAGPSGKTITRFNAFERFTHWLTAGCFIVLAFSGLNVTFGKSVLLPVIGPEAFTALSIGAKYAHNYLGFPFMAGVILMFLIWVRHNIPHGGDLKWLLAGGGLVGGHAPPSKRFNGGQKIVFWTVIIGGVALSVSGLYLLFPYEAGGVINLQFWNSVHGIVSVLMIALMLAHAYIGSIGMEGAFDAMGSGEVDLNWAKEHHGLWVQEEMSKGISPAGRMVPAE
ncbi:MAG: formate dehydrogenase subunit gamma [Bosea sp. (in: a-proteobacteria)]